MDTLFWVGTKKYFPFSGHRRTFPRKFRQAGFPHAAII
jgi:hypothetical protein